MDIYIYKNREILNLDCVYWINSPDLSIVVECTAFMAPQILH